MKKKKTKSSVYPGYDFGGIIQAIPQLAGLLGGIANQDMSDPNPIRVPQSSGVNIETPMEALAQNDITKAKAALKANNNNWVKGLTIGGGLAQQFGSMLMSYGKSGQVSSTETLGGNEISNTGVSGWMNRNAGSFAFGGAMDMTGANVEGEEVIETPDGKVVKMKGPSHANGGIDIMAPEGTEVFSKRLKGPDGKTMADRKISREKELAKITKLLDKNPSDPALRNSYKKTKMANEIEETEDMAKMQFAKTMSEVVDTFMTGGIMKKPAYAYGGPIGTDPNQYKGIQYSKGYGLNQYQPYLEMYGSIPDSTYSNADWGDVENRKAFQTMIGTKPDGIFGPDTLAKAKAYYANQNSRTPQTAVTGTPVAPVTGSTVPMSNPAIDKQGITNYFNNLPLNDDATLSSTDTRPYTGNQNIVAKEGAPNPDGTWWDRNMGDTFNNITMGDMVGMAGTLYSTFAPMKNTLENRAGDQPNINAYKNYGKDTLKKLDDSKQFQDDVRDNALKDLELSRNATIRRGRNSARSVNTMRALDLAADMGINQVKVQIYDNFAKTMQGIFGAEASALADRDMKVMGGEERRDLADRQDRDNFYSQMAQDIATKGTGIQKIGKDVNTMKERNVTGKVINQMYNDFGVNAMSGNIKKKRQQTISTNAEYLSTIPDKAVANKVIEKIEAGTWVVKGNQVYNKSTGKAVDINKD